jgi:RNA polymerase sigma factor (TIGR02999 family)
MAENEATVAELLIQAQSGGAVATAALIPVMYGELRRLAEVLLRQSPPGRTLQATALVHEAYLRLIGSSQGQWENKGHFFGAAAQAMRRILVEQARAKAAGKRGGDRSRVDPALADLALDPPSDDILALHEALERLEQADARKAQIVTLHFFAGLTLPEIAEVLGTSVSTVEREWRFTRALLHHEIGMTDSA